MALLDVYHAAVSDSIVKQSFIGAMIVAASQILTEDPGTSNHANRLLWAAAVQADPQTEGASMWRAAMSSATVVDAIKNGADVTDNAVQNVCNGLIDTVATGE